MPGSQQLGCALGINSSTTSTATPLINSSLRQNRLLVCMLVLSHLCMGAVSAPTKSFVDGIEKHVEKEMLSPEDEAARYQRQYRLINTCSQKFVQLLGEDVRARGKDENDEYAELLVNSRTFNSQVTIQSRLSLRFLCFNKRGRLVLKESGDSKLCHFLEYQSHNHTHTQFISVYDNTFKIGFKRNGKPLRANAWLENRRLRRCFTFLKHGADSGSLGSPAPAPWGPILGVDFSKHAKLTMPETPSEADGHKHRHRHGDADAKGDSGRQRKSRTRKLSRRGKKRKKKKVPTATLR